MKLGLRMGCLSLKSPTTQTYWTRFGSHLQSHVVVDKNLVDAETARRIAPRMWCWRAISRWAEIFSCRVLQEPLCLYCSLEGIRTPCLQVDASKFDDAKDGYFNSHLRIWFSSLFLARKGVLSCQQSKTVKARLPKVSVLDSVQWWAFGWGGQVCRG
jgi:hypothetical protein